MRDGVENLALVLNMVYLFGLENFCFFEHFDSEVFGVDFIFDEANPAKSS